jgi:hypothetical protein
MNLELHQKQVLYLGYFQMHLQLQLLLEYLNLNNKKLLLQFHLEKMFYIHRLHLLLQ